MRNGNVSVTRGVADAPLSRWNRRGSKSFLLLFFKKEVLAHYT
jgi:hypothetical protein